MSTPYERLMAEEIPTGTFGHARPPKPPQARHTPRWTPEEQAQHLADLLAELDVRKRHLRLITNQPDQTAA